MLYLNANARIQLDSKSNSIEPVLQLGTNEGPIDSVDEISAFSSAEEGVLKVNLDTSAEDTGIDLEKLIPEVSDLKYLTGVQFSLNREVILEGDFT